MPYKEQLTWIGFAFKPGQAYPPPPQKKKMPLMNLLFQSRIR